MIAILTGVRFYLVVALIEIFLMVSDVEHRFMCLLASFFLVWKKMSIQVLCPFLITLFIFWYLSCMSCSCTLDIKPLIGHTIYKYFLPFSRLSLHCVDGFLLSLMRSHLFIFAFVSFTLGVKSKKMLLWFISKTVLPGSGFIISEKLNNFQFNKKSYNKCLLKS